MIPPLMSSLASPFWGALADRTGKDKLILLQGLILSSCTRILVGTGIFADSFPLCALVYAAGEILSSPCDSIAEANIVGELKRGEAANLKVPTYGQMRLFAALGWGTMAFVSGAAARASPSYPFVFFAVLMAVAGIVANMLVQPRDRNFPRGDPSKPAPVKASPLAVLGVLWREHFLFSLTGVMSGYAHTTIGTVLYLHLDHLGGTRALMGLSTFVACMAVALVFANAEPIFKWFPSSYIRAFDLMMFTLRMALYSVITEPYAVLPVEILHGFTWALNWGLFMREVASLFPPEVRNTAVGALYLIYVGMGSGLGAYGSAWLYSNYGSVWAFRYTAMATGLLGLITIATALYEKHVSGGADMELISSTSQGAVSVSSKELGAVSPGSGTVRTKNSNISDRSETSPLQKNDDANNHV